jgi:hypothetical protein
VRCDAFFYYQRFGASTAAEPLRDLAALDDQPYFTNGQGQHSGIGSWAWVLLEAAKNEIAIAAMNRIFFSMSYLFSLVNCVSCLVTLS